MPKKKITPFHTASIHTVSGHRWHLARLWQQQGQRTAAYELLAPLAGWFTEGWDTADLRDAHAGVEALASADG